MEVGVEPDERHRLLCINYDIADRGDHIVVDSDHIVDIPNIIGERSRPPAL